MIRAIASVAVAAVTGAGAATVVPMSQDAPMTYFATCNVADRGHAVFGGAIRWSSDGDMIEIVGPLAHTSEGARRAAAELQRAYGPAIDDRCEPTPMDEVWMVGLDYCHPARVATGRAVC